MPVTVASLAPAGLLMGRPRQPETVRRLDQLLEGITARYPAMLTAEEAGQLVTVPCNGRHQADWCGSRHLTGLRHLGSWEVRRHITQLLTDGLIRCIREPGQLLRWQATQEALDLAQVDAYYSSLA
jgi:hypothetical protein